MKFKRIKAFLLTACLAGSMTAGSFTVPVFAAEASAQADKVNTAKAFKAESSNEAKAVKASGTESSAKTSATKTSGSESSEKASAAKTSGNESSAKTSAAKTSGTESSEKASATKASGSESSEKASAAKTSGSESSEKASAAKTSETEISKTGMDTVTLEDGTTITCPEGWDSNDPQWVKEYLKEFKPDSLAETMPSKLAGSMSALASYTKTTWKKYNGGTITAYHDSRNTEGNDLVPVIDVSKWEGSIDWDEVKDDGIDYVLIRAAYQGASNGTLSQDPKYKSYIEGALDAGLKVGVYIYSQAISTDEAVEQADYLIDCIRDYDVELPVIFDYEYYTSSSGRLYNAHLSRDEKTEICNAFCEEVKSQGYDPMLYAGMTFLKTEMNGEEFAQNYPVWAARYNSYLYKASSSVKTSSLYQGDVEIWQNSSSAAVSGINHEVDFNYWYKDPDWQSGNPGYNGNNQPVNPYAQTGTTLAKQDKTEDSVTVSWTPVSDATGYIVSMSDAYDGDYQEVELGSGATSYKFDNLNAGQIYYFRIQPIQGEYKGKTSSPYAVTTKGVISGLRMKTTASSLNMRSHAGTSSVCKTVKKLKKGSVVTYKGQTRSSSGGVWYKVKSASKTGYVSANYVKYYVEPVSALKQQGTSSSQISLSWTASADAASYTIYRSSALNGTYKKIASTTKTSYTDKNVKAGTIYYYKVKATKKISDQTLTSSAGTVTMYAAGVNTFTVKTTKKTPLRQAAGDSYTKLVTIPKSKKLSITYTTVDKNNTPWYEVKYTKSGKTYTGYIKSTYVKKV